MVDEDSTRLGNLFDKLILVLVVLSIVMYSIETLPSLSPATLFWLHGLQWIVVVLFTLEYGLRIWVADRPITYIISFFGIIDLLAILPFYIGIRSGLQTLRAFRLFRVFRVLKVLRYSKAMRRFSDAFLLCREELVLFLITTMILIYLASVGIFFFEHDAQPEKFASIFHSMWWAVATLTTVGYGDVYPVTLGGRLFTFLVLVVGLGIVTVPAGMFAAALSRARELDG
ncbi:ion transporter [Synechococcus sp. RSCCF101]|nr:ion transporter [Synechococcus sp. RSCCF101]